MELREKLKQEYALRQAAIKAEPLEITYSYYNGTGHRRTVTVRKGDTIGQFLKAVIEQLKGHFRELRCAGALGVGGCGVGWAGGRGDCRGRLRGSNATGRPWGVWARCWLGLHPVLAQCIGSYRPLNTTIGTHQPF